MLPVTHPKERLFYIDRLRVIAIAGVIFVHLTMPFQAVKGVWMIQFEQNSLVFSLTSAFFFQWIMHLFFFLAGASACLALNYRSRRRFISERVTRLGVPLLFGLLVIQPFQKYLSLLSTGQFSGSLGAFYCYFYNYCTQGPAPVLLAYGCLVGHLWFLGFLLVYSTACLPVLSWLKNPQGARWLARLAVFCQRPAALLVFILPVALIQVMLKARFPEHQNWSDFFVWLVYFLTGYIFIMDKRFMDMMVRVRWIALGTGLACFTTIILLLTSGERAKTWELMPEFSWGYALYQVLRSLNSWAWVVFVMGIGIACLNKDSPFLKQASDAVLPVYILHHPVVVGMAFLLLDWQTSIWMKLPVFGILVLVITLGVYAGVIRRWNVTRFLFGMRLIS